MPSATWLVDDDFEFCALAAEVAERIGISITAMTPDEAEQFPDGRLADAVIVDGQPFRVSSLPGSTEASEKLPRYIERADRILVCTAYLDDDLDAERIADPRVRLLRKPFDLDTFEAALAWLVDDAAANEGPADRAWADAAASQQAPRGRIFEGAGRH